MLQIVNGLGINEVHLWQVKQLERRADGRQTVLVEREGHPRVLVPQEELLELGAVVEALETVDPVAFEVELLQTGAVLEAVHATQVVVEQVDLPQLLQVVERRGAQLSQVVLLQVQDLQVGGLLAQHGLLVPVDVGGGHGAQPHFSHLEMRHFFQEHAVGHLWLF